MHVQKLALQSAKYKALFENNDNLSEQVGPLCPFMFQSNLNFISLIYRRFTGIWKNIWSLRAIHWSGYTNRGSVILLKLITVLCRPLSILQITRGSCYLQQNKTVKYNWCQWHHTEDCHYPNLGWHLLWPKSQLPIYRALAGVDVWRVTMSSVLPFLSKPFGSSYSVQQSTVLGISVAIPAIRSTSWPPRFLEIVDASIDG